MMQRCSHSGRQVTTNITISTCLKALKDHVRRQTRTKETTTGVVVSFVHVYWVLKDHVRKQTRTKETMTGAIVSRSWRTSLRLGQKYNVPCTLYFVLWVPMGLMGLYRYSNCSGFHLQSVPVIYYNAAWGYIK